jgi:hypothetical protein
MVVESTGRQRVLSFLVLLKPTLIWGGLTQEIPTQLWTESIQRGWVVPSQVRVVWTIPRQTTWAPNFSNFLPASGVDPYFLFQPDSSWCWCPLKFENTGFLSLTILPFLCFSHSTYSRRGVSWRRINKTVIRTARFNSARSPERGRSCL